MFRHERGVLDTSVLIDYDLIEEAVLPNESSIATLTLAELAVSLHSVSNLIERAARQQILQFVESKFHAIPFDAEAARAYGRVYAAVVADGRKPRGGRAVDFLIAATALSRGLPLFTRNAADFSSLSELLNIIAV